MTCLATFWLGCGLHTSHIWISERKYGDFCVQVALGPVYTPSMCVRYRRWKDAVGEVGYGI